MLRYQMTPAAASAAVASQLPAEVAAQRDTQRPTLIMTLHPHCSCSRASVTELSVLMARASGRLAARVLFVQPPGATADWVHTDLWQAATEVPGAVVSVDADGKESAALGATTSGTVLLYGRDGQILFHGGITDGRGHEGDNPGLLAILSLLRCNDPVLHSTPVYGCPLTSTSCPAPLARNAQ